MIGRVTPAPVVQAVWGQYEEQQKVPKPRGHLTGKRHVASKATLSFGGAAYCCR